MVGGRGHKDEDSKEGQGLGNAFDPEGWKTTSLKGVRSTHQFGCSRESDCIAAIMETGSKRLTA